MESSNHSSPGRNDVPTELKAIVITIRVLLIIATIFGNSLVIRAFYKFSSLQSASNTILVSLSVADILMTIAFILQIANIIVGKTDKLYVEYLWIVRMFCGTACVLGFVFAPFEQ